MSRAPAVVVFDVNETLSDLAPLADRFVDVGAPAHLAQTWFASVLRDGFALAAAGTSEPFAAIAASVLRTVLAQAGVADVEAGVAHVVQGFAQLAVHDDVPDGVRALHAAGCTLVTLSNGSADVADGLLTRAGVREHFSQLLSVEQAGLWKPTRVAYEHAARACGVAPDELMLVAVHPWDVDGAARAGLRTAWVDRAGTPYPTHLRAPELVATSLPDLARQLEG